VNRKIENSLIIFGIVFTVVIVILAGALCAGFIDRVIYDLVTEMMKHVAISVIVIILLPVILYELFCFP
jgi:hypothetical protein